MRKMKKMAAFVIAMVMVLAMAVPAMAAKGDTHTISVPSSDTHTYDVYQILVGDLSEGTLSNMEWGSSVNTPTDGKVNGKTAAEFAKSLAGKSGVDVVSEVDKYFTKGESTKVGQIDKDHPYTAKEGYYVMVDVTDPLKHDNDTDTKALNVIRLVADVEVEKKWSTTSDVKTIVADTLGKDTGENEYDPGVDNDNVSIGDVVKFNIAATVPENTDKFKAGTFFFVITDKLSDGLTFNDDIEVYLGDSTTALAKTAYTVKKDVNGNTFEIGLINAGSDTYRGQIINVKYSATVNKDAVIGDAGNPNTSKVQFSNDPNKTYDGTPEDSQNPGFPDSTKDVPTGETPESKTITYVTGIEIQKVDENGEPLTGATFELSGDSTKIVVTKTVSYIEDTSEDAKYWKLKDGTYTMTAPTTENTMVAAASGATKGYVVDAEATGEGVITIGETKYRPVTTGETATHVLKEGSADAYDSTTTKYKKTVTEKAANDVKTTHKLTEAVDANGVARFDGLGAGTYTIKETVTPAGYNTMEDIELTVTYNENGTAKFSVSGGNAKYEDGVVKVEIYNLKGSTLPTTGGIGTTIFYVVGAILVLFAGILLVTRRRMSVK